MVSTLVAPHVWRSTGTGLACVGGVATLWLGGHDWVASGPDVVAFSNSAVPRWQANVIMEFVATIIQALIHESVECFTDALETEQSMPAVQRLTTLNI